MFIHRKRYTGREDSSHYCMARIRGNNRQAITQASISSIACNVFDLSGATPDTAILTPSVVVASAVFDTYQTGEEWDEDSTGYNFGFMVPKEGFPTGDHVYRVEFVFTPTSGDTLSAVFEVYASPIRSS